MLKQLKEFLLERDNVVECYYCKALIFNPESAVVACYKCSQWNAWIEFWNEVGFYMSKGIKTKEDAQTKLGEWLDYEGGL